MKTSRRNFLFTTGLGTLSMSLLSNSESFGFFAAGLPRKSPESQGVSSVAVRNFLKATKASGLEWHSFMLLRHGNVVAEGWWKPFQADYMHTLYSLSKSFTSTAIGFLVQEGKISVNDPVIQFFPDDLPDRVSDHLKAMKIKNLLTMNTGHESDTMPQLRAQEPQSWVKSFLAHPVVHLPGSHFLYNTGATYMLGAIIHKVTGQTLEQYLQPRLFGPLNITGYDWEKSPEGLNTAGYGLRVKTEDIAKLGQLYLKKGKWQGKQLLSPSWIEEATSKQTTSQAGDNDWSQGYGYQFWRCKPGFYRGDGAYGQFCMVMPEQDAVLVMTSESWDLQKSMDVAYQTLLPAFQTKPLATNASELAALKDDISKLEIPVAKASVTSPESARHGGKSFRVNANAYGVTQLEVGLNKDTCVLKMATTQGEIKITAGWEKWYVNSQTMPYIFPVATRIAIPSKIAASATWINESTLQLDLKFVEAIHGDSLTLTFEKDSVRMDFMNSISKNTKNFPEKRSPLTANLIE
ncbi:serine hydrolase domain-containing protein [Arundinibacter roseus]|uniref:Class C beta-lactamase-related serine hydrolase n=1 Tax=Arundinibacter roseus TaxID=2070510 RepID=A0A4R4K5S4_9BACT|nr:serine hydrolase [Arundinibacter roseus]TDB62730.1 class C beta-lactamase-related serine hydrolase [Arundinibacter roseus]